MKFYTITGNAEYGEQPAKDARTGERVTITDARAALTAGSYITVYRCEIVHDEDNGKPTESAFQFLVMPDAYSLSVYVCDFEIGEQIIATHLHNLLSESMNSATLDAILSRLQKEYMNRKETQAWKN